MGRRINSYLAKCVVELQLQLGVSGSKRINMIDETIKACYHDTELLLAWFLRCLHRWRKVSIMRAGKSKMMSEAERTWLRKAKREGRFGHEVA